jgi:hypothetical protein
MGRGWITVIGGAEIVGGGALTVWPDLPNWIGFGLMGFGFLTIAYGFREVLQERAGRFLLPRVRVALDWGAAAPPVSQPYNMTAHDAFRHIRVYSQWASGKSDQDGMQPLGSSLLEQIDGKLRDQASEGLIRVWGRPRIGSALRQARVQIPREYWRDAGFELVRCWIYPNVSPHTWVHRGASPEYEDVAFNAAEIQRQWPKASWFRRRRDPYLKERDNDAFDIAEREGTKWRVDGI